MKYKFAKMAAILLLGFIACGSASATDWWASSVVSSSRLSNSPYDDPLATIGKPSTWMNESGVVGDPDPCAISMVRAACGVGLQGEKLVTTIKQKSMTQPAGHITVKFTTPIYDDPQNWYGKDFIVFGNGFFTTGGSDITNASNMEILTTSAFSDVAAACFEPMPVSVSQDGVTWYPFTDGPYADDYAPTQAFAWDWIENRWLKNSAGKEVELDFTKPVDPLCSVLNFDQQNVAHAIDMYGGSGGGTAFDLADLPYLPIDANGKKWIQYIRVEGYGTGGEVDAFARVSNEISSVSIGEAKKLTDGAHVVLTETVVSAATYETGRFCYVQHQNRCGGIRIIGRVLDRGRKVIIQGDMDTFDGERVILATSVSYVGDVTSDVKPLGMPNKAIDGAGLSTSGLLVRTWGKVKSVDSVTKAFVIDDGSGREIKCIAPRTTPSAGESPNPGDPNWGVSVKSNFTPPDQDHFKVVTGISSMEPDGLGGFVPIIRLRNTSDTY